MVGTIVKGALRNWKWLAVGGVLAHAKANDQSVIKSTVDLSTGLLNIQKKDGETTAGAVLRDGIDSVTNEGTTDKALDRLKGTARDMGDAAHDMAGATRQLTSGGGIMDSISKIFSSLTSGISNFLGGGSSGLNFGALAMLPLAWFTFGKFGWLGKVGALAMLMYGLSNMFKTQEQPRQMAVQPVRSSGEGRELPSAKDNYDALEREQQRQSQGQEDDMYNVRAKI